MTALFLTVMDDKKTLFINACIRKNSRTEALARKALEKISRNSSCKELDLKTMHLLPFDEEMLIKRDEDIKNADFSAEDYFPAKDFADADKIVIAAPLWDCTFPSLLKVFFEHICVNSLTFAYSEKGELLKLCRADELVYICTAGGPVFEDSALYRSISELCELFSIPRFRLVCADKLDMLPERAEEFLNQAYEKLVSDE